MQQSLDQYIESHCSSLPSWLHNIYRRTNLELLNGRMCSGPVQGTLLTMLTRMIAPRRVMELGTFSGFSSLCISRGLNAGDSIDTIEADDELEEFILQSFSEAPNEISSRIRLHIGDALKVIKTFEPKTFDMVFIDADKREYSAYYEAVFPLVKPGGFILADNTLWDGHVTDPAYDRDRQTLGVRKFNELVAKDCRVSKVIIPVRDGLTLIRVDTN